MTGATSVAAGGDGYAYICAALAEEGTPDEPTMVAAFDLPGSAAQRLFEALRTAGVRCALVLFGKDAAPDA
eukprot:10487966-Lingulodinium_polyedra.AAC.1